MGAEEKLADREHGVERGRILEPPVRVPVDLAEGQQRRRVSATGGWWCAIQAEVLEVNLWPDKRHFLTKLVIATVSPGSGIKGFDGSIRSMPSLLFPSFVHSLVTKVVTA